MKYGLVSLAPQKNVKIKIRKKNNNINLIIFADYNKSVLGLIRWLEEREREISFERKITEKDRHRSLK